MKRRIFRLVYWIYYRLPMSMDGKAGDLVEWMYEHGWDNAERK